MRVVICDDHPVYRDGLAALLEQWGADVVGQASSGEEALDLVARLRPDLVVMDLGLPGIGGVATTARLARTHPAVPVLVVTMAEEHDAMIAALRAGARGYLVKGAGHVEIRAAIDTVVRGGVSVGPPVASGLVPVLRSSSPFPQLTPREREVLGLVSRGRTDPHIAVALQLSVKTVRNVVSSVMSKLGVPTRAQAVAVARDAGVGGW